MNVKSSLEGKEAHTPAQPAREPPAPQLADRENPGPFLGLQGLPEGVEKWRSGASGADQSGASKDLALKPKEAGRGLE